MKHHLSGVAVAALIAAGLPAWAQTKTPDQTRPAASGPVATASSPSASSRSTGTTAGKTSQHASKRPAAHKRGGRSPEDDMAEELNRQELARVTQGAGQTTAGSGATAMPSHNKINGGAASHDASGIPK